MVTSRKKKRWVFPKGIREPDLSPWDSAAQEALEEAGVEGAVSPTSVGTCRYDKWGGTCTVEVFSMEVETLHESWLEDFRDRQWVSLDEAAGRVQEQELRRILGCVPDVLAELAPGPPW